jgi:cell division inhibitor SepF
MSFFKRAMDYLGLGPDDAYDDYDVPPEPERQMQSRASREQDFGQSQRPPRGYGDEGDGTVRTVAQRPSFPRSGVEAPSTRRPIPAGDDSGVQPRPMNAPRQGSAVRSVPTSSGEPYTVRPRHFNQAQEVADKFKEGLPVIMNLEGTEREVSRRLIDFASGLCYALNGSMEKVATGVYLLKPVAHRPASYGDYDG